MFLGILLPIGTGAVSFGMIMGAVTPRLGEERAAAASGMVNASSDLVGKLFGTENLATLFGIVFVAHQSGSFLSTWLGGKCLEATGDYILIWLAAAVLSFAAMVFSYSIKEK